MYAFGLAVFVGLFAASSIAIPAPAPADPSPSASASPPPPAPQTFPMDPNAPCSCLTKAPDGSQVRIPLNNTEPPFSVGISQCITGSTIGGCPVVKEDY